MLEKENFQITYFSKRNEYIKENNRNVEYKELDLNALNLDSKKVYNSTFI